MRRIDRLIMLTAISAALSGTCAATASAAAFVRCGTAQAGALVSPHWAQSGPEQISISNRSAASIGRRIGQGVEGAHGTVAEVRCAVAFDVGVEAAMGWVKSPRRRFSVGVHILGAGRNPYLGRFRCTVLPVGRHEAGSCTHAPDRHAARIAVKFRIVRVGA